MTNASMKSNVISYLRKIARSRKNRAVTADDVHTYINRYTRGKRFTTMARLSIINSVFSGTNFTALSEVASQREAAKNRYITLWRVK